MVNNTKMETVRDETIDEQPLPEEVLWDEVAGRPTSLRDLSIRDGKRLDDTEGEIGGITDWKEYLDAILDAEAAEIIGDWSFKASGALQIGKYIEGEYGDVKISPDGIVARNKDNDNTFTLSGITGNISLRGTLTAGSIVTAKIIAESDSEVDWSYIQNIKVENIHINEKLTVSNTDADVTADNPQAISWLTDSGSFKDMAFEDKVELAKLGETIVEGGYLKTILIDAEYIKAGTLTGRTVQTAGEGARMKMHYDSSTLAGYLDFMYDNDVLARLETVALFPGSAGFKGELVAANLASGEVNEVNVAWSGSDLYDGVAWFRLRDEYCGLYYNSDTNRTVFLATTRYANSIIPDVDDAISIGLSNRRIAYIYNWDQRIYGNLRLGSITDVETLLENIGTIITDHEERILALEGA